MNYEYRPATVDDLEHIWDKNIADNNGDPRWITWKDACISDNRDGKCKSFIFLCDEVPMGEGTLLFSSECDAIAGRTALANGKTIANINALRNDKIHERKGHISRLVQMMERYAFDAGYTTITIGVEAKETRNLAIYLHWGYCTFIMSEVEDDELVLYYAKMLVI